MKQTGESFTYLPKKHSDLLIKSSIANEKCQKKTDCSKNLRNHKREEYKINGNEKGKIRAEKSFHDKKTAICYIDAQKSEI